MKIYSNQPPLTKFTENSIFLCGPTPRSSEVISWRIKALELLSGFSGVICIPERDDWHNLSSYLEQVEWEYSCLENCEKIICWLPRNMENMIGLTTNVEFGYWIGKKSFFYYGRPDDAPNTRYLDWLYEKETGEKPFNSLEKLLNAVR